MIETETKTESVKCPRCGAEGPENIKKIGTQFSKNGKQKPRYECKTCKENNRTYTFTEEELYERTIRGIDEAKTCPNCGHKMNKGGFKRNKRGEFAGQERQRYICTNKDCGHLELVPLKGKEEVEQQSIQNSEQANLVQEQQTEQQTIVPVDIEDAKKAIIKNHQEMKDELAKMEKVKFVIERYRKSDKNSEADKLEKDISEKYPKAWKEFDEFKKFVDDEEKQMKEDGFI